MDTLKHRDRVEHVTDSSKGIGVVTYVDEVAGESNIHVMWELGGDSQRYTAAQLRRVPTLVERLANVGPASTVPFQLKVLGRWFEERHEIAGEITNQPFDMLPHQVIVAHRVLTSPPAEDDGRHWLIADDVGLGKTIEAGMILEVMRRRAGGSLRCLIVVPASLKLQWKAELAERFGRNFEIFEGDVNQLANYDQLIAPIDTLKSLVAKNKSALDVTPWDLVMFDEAHHLTKPGVQKYDLAKALRDSKKARNVLLLTATPHSGSHEHFVNLLHILRPDLVKTAQRQLKALPDLPLAEMVIRNRKALVTDSKGAKIFKGIAKTRILQYHPSSEEVTFADELHEYLRHGYAEASKLEGNSKVAVGFLMATFGKLGSSSREALRAALLSRRDNLRRGEDDTLEGLDDEATVVPTAGNAKGKKGKKTLINGELKTVEQLLGHLEKLPIGDSKRDGFIRELKQLVRSDPSLKLLIFTEYRATQSGLEQVLKEEFGELSVGVVNGARSMEDRRRVVDQFNREENPRFLLSTAAGGEGLNMQERCHTVVNYDLPWNPNVLQQRIGRVYRYGQKESVIVYNLKVVSDSPAFADNKVYDYLQKKLEDVADALAKAQGDGGEREDLLGDILGQAAEQGLSLEELHRDAVALGAKKVNETIDTKAKHLEEIVKNPELLGLFKGLPRFNLDDYAKVQARVSKEHLQHFVEKYCAEARVDYRPASATSFSFKPSASLAEIAEDYTTRDPYTARKILDASRVERATVDKDAARIEGLRLLRFGDPVFDAMVRHVQYREFSAVASLDIEARHLGWSERSEGAWLLFQLTIARTEGRRTLTLRREIASFLVRAGSSEAEERVELVEKLHTATSGRPAKGIDLGAAAQAYNSALKAANIRLGVLREDVRAEHHGDLTIAALPVVDLGMAWVRAS